MSGVKQELLFSFDRNRPIVAMSANYWRCSEMLVGQPTHCFLRMPIRYFSKGSLRSGDMLPGLLLLSVALHPALGWGGVFNRFSPEMLSNLGYGGHGSSLRVQPFLQNPGAMETLHEMEEGGEMEGPCYGKRCTANEHCCNGYVCVDVDGGGSCMFPYGLGQGELCRRHSDCNTGLVCSDTGDGSKTCQPPFSAPKHYSEDCTISSECDIHRGLCCQLQRRHRQVARKMCSYFTDPMVCLGPVASDHVKVDMERTTGEKRITGKTPFFV